MPRVPKAQRRAQKRSRLRARGVDADNIAEVSIVDLLLHGLAVGEGDALTCMIDALTFEIDACARFNEERPELGNLFDVWARRLRVISEVRSREIGGRLE